MSPSLKNVFPVVLLASTASAAFPWIYPAAGNNVTTFMDGDKVIASWGAQSGNVSYMALNCGKSPDFNDASTVGSAITTWTNLATSLTYNVKSIDSYGSSQYCRFCTSKSGGECSISFHVEPKASGHAATTWFANGNAPVGANVPGASSPGPSSSGNGTSAAPNSTTVAPPASPPTTAPPAATSTKAHSGATAVHVSGLAMGALAFVAFVAL